MSGPQQSIESLPDEQQDGAMHETGRASKKYPSRVIQGVGLHICQMYGEWQVWINTEDADFTGLCVGSGLTRDVAVGEAVRSLEAVLDALQGPPS